MCTKLRVWAIAACGLMLASVAHADEWPQWMGPQRDDVYREDGIVDSIPPEGLPVKWRAPVAWGYSGPAVAGGRVFLTDFVVESGTSNNNSGGRDKLTGVERTLCFDAASGAPVWTFENPCTYNISYANGPRATPTIDADRVYVLGAQGDLLCLRADSGGGISSGNSHLGPRRSSTSTR